MYIEYCLWAQVAVLNHKLLYWTVWDRFMQVLYLGRAPRIKETLRDFREKCRVTRHSRIFRGLTGSRRTPGFWGVTPANDYDTLRVFGSTSYYHVKESKLDPRAKKALFMGVTSSVKGYRLWCLSSKKIISRRDVTFDESAMLKKVTTYGKV